MEFKKTYSKLKQKIDIELQKYLEEIKEENKKYFLKEFYGYINDYILKGGKRLRPIMTLMAYKAFGGKDEKKVMPAVLSIELLHNYSVILDDIMDEDMQRRGNPNVNLNLKNYFLKNFEERKYEGNLFNYESSRFSTSFALMLGCIVDLHCKKLILNLGYDEKIKNKIARIMIEKDIILFQGQMMDVYNEYNKNILQEDYIQMVRGKQGHLFALSLMVGAILAGASQKEIDEIGKYGNDMAVAFQIQDDIIDIDKTSSKGNTFASDIIKGKRTLMVLHALEKADDEDKEILLNILDKKDNLKEEIEKAISLFEKMESIKYAKDIAKNYLISCQESLKKLNIDEESREFFYQLSNFMVTRNI